MSVNKGQLIQQAQHWENMLSSRPEMFGTSPSSAALKAVQIFEKEAKTNILELGGGQGRDSLFFAQSGFNIQVLDYCQSGVDSIMEKAEKLNLSHHISTMRHDIRKALPFDDNSFDACYSHMLYCMALTTDELEFLSSEVRRVLKPGGLNIYTVRHTGDSHFGTGTHRGEDMYEVGGFIVHYFSKEKVEYLAQGYEVVEINEFEEGTLPRKLFRVTLRKK